MSLIEHWTLKWLMGRDSKYGVSSHHQAPTSFLKGKVIKEVWKSNPIDIDNLSIFWICNVCAYTQ